MSTYLDEVQSSEALTSFLERIRAELPQLSVSKGKDVLREKSRDRWPEAAKWTDKELDAHEPKAVLQPGSTDDVSAIARIAHELGIALIPYGAGSGVVGAVVGSGNFVSLDMGAMTGVLAFDDERGEVTAAAGTLGTDLEAALAERGRRVPHYPQSLPLATIGGLVATRSSGTFSSKYGNIEDMLVGLEVVLADGSVITTRSVPRSSTGPSIPQIFVGSEGTLGVITAVTLRTLPIAFATRFRGIAFDRLNQGIEAVRTLMDGGIRPAVIRLYDAGEAVHLFERSGVDGEGRALLILGFDGHDTVVEAEEGVALALCGESGGLDLGPGPGETWERTRFDASWLDRGNAGDTSFADAIEVSAAWPALHSLHDQVLEAIAPHVDVAYAHYSHFYPNGAAIYFIFFTSGTDREAALARYRSAWELAITTVQKAGGSMGHHHGVGEARKRWMASEHGEGLQVLSAVKNALDPRGILAPGKLGLAAHKEGTQR